LFPVDDRVIETRIEAPTPEGIAQATFFIRTENDKGDSGGPNRSQLGHRDLPRAQNLEQKRLYLVTDFVEFVD
jgi:hypothetical protein